MKIEFVDWKKDLYALAAKGRGCGIDRFWDGKLIYLNAWRFSVIIDLRDPDEWYEEMTGKKPKFVRTKEVGGDE